MLPADWLKASGAAPIEVTLHRSTAPSVANPSQQFSQLVEKYWPTVAALGLGLVLLTLVVRKPNFGERAGKSEGRVLSMAGHQDADTDAGKNAKERINRMFRDDPDKAAATIESWIKKAS
jgi:flagellar biosynthesis/type III secretory pathway M-ring protein FliF/YscJ